LTDLLFPTLHIGLRLLFRCGGDDDAPRARFHRERVYSGPLNIHGSSLDQRFINGFSSASKPGMLPQDKWKIHPHFDYFVQHPNV
jgi:hypothetical protein